MCNLLRNKLFVIVMVSAALALGYCIFNGGTYKPVKFSEDEFSLLTENMASPELQQRFSEDFLRCIGREELDVSSLKLDRLDGRFILPDKPDAAVIFKLHPKLNYVAVYEKRNGGYVFFSLIDSFFELTGYEAAEVGGKDMLIVREYIDQRTGAFEESEFIRGYYCSKKGFKLALSLLNRYDARWNEQWAGGSDSWLKVEQSAAKEFISGEKAVLRVVKKQSFGTCGASVESSPYDLDFVIEDEREIYEEYRWSAEWEHFILFEAENIRTGGKAAVIELLMDSPYELYKSTGAFNEYKVLHPNGEVTVENKSDYNELGTNTNEERKGNR